MCYDAEYRIRESMLKVEDLWHDVELLRGCARDNPAVPELKRRIAANAWRVPVTSQIEIGKILMRY